MVDAFDLDEHVTGVNFATTSCATWEEVLVAINQVEQSNEWAWTSLTICPLEGVQQITEQLQQGWMIPPG